MNTNLTLIYLVSHKLSALEIERDLLEHPFMYVRLLIFLFTLVFFMSDILYLSLVDLLVLNVQYLEFPTVSTSLRELACYIDTFVPTLFVPLRNMG